jgi:putative tryptophan/tyrosine transport system substrate-binding protein
MSRACRSRSADLADKRLKILRELLPNLRRLAIMGNVGYRAAVLAMDEAQTAARMLGINTNTPEIRHAEDIASGIDALRDRADALYVCTDALINANHVRITGTWHASPNDARPSGARGVGRSRVLWNNYPDLFRRSADYVDRILQGRSRPTFRWSSPPNLISYSI